MLKYHDLVYMEFNQEMNLTLDGPTVGVNLCSPLERPALASCTFTSSTPCSAGSVLAVSSDMDILKELTKPLKSSSSAAACSVDFSVPQRLLASSVSKSQLLHSFLQDV